MSDADYTEDDLIKLGRGGVLGNLGQLLLANGLAAARAEIERLRTTLAERTAERGAAVRERLAMEAAGRTWSERAEKAEAELQRRVDYATTVRTQDLRISSLESTLAAAQRQYSRDVERIAELERERDGLLSIAREAIARIGSEKARGFFAARLSAYDAAMSAPQAAQESE